MVKNLSRLVCFGDSITQAWAFSYQDAWPARLQRGLQDKGSRILVYNRGVSGDTTVQALDRFDVSIRPHLPAWVLISFGMNDSNVRVGRKTARVGVEEYSRNLAEILRMIRAEGGEGIFLCLYAPSVAKQSTLKAEKASRIQHMAVYPAYRKAMISLARKEGCPLIDIPAGLKAVGKTTSNLLHPDGVHLSVEGNHLLARLILPTLLKTIYRVH